MAHPLLRKTDTRDDSSHHPELGQKSPGTHGKPGLIRGARRRAVRELALAERGESFHERVIERERDAAVSHGAPCLCLMHLIDRDEAGHVEDLA